jgi:hypothetical protein
VPSFAELFAILEDRAVKAGLMEPGGAPPVKEWPKPAPAAPEQTRLPGIDREPGEDDE